jgi:hypothetical protein
MSIVKCTRGGISRPYTNSLTNLTNISSRYIPRERDNSGDLEYGYQQLEVDLGILTLYHRPINMFCIFSDSSVVASTEYLVQEWQMIILCRDNNDNIPRIMILQRFLHVHNIFFTY